MGYYGDFSRICIRSLTRTIMRSKFNFVSILKTGHQDVERITVESVKGHCSQAPEQLGSPVLYTLLFTDNKPNPYCTLSTILRIACTGFDCCIIVPSVQC